MSLKRLAGEIRFDNVGGVELRGRSGQVGPWSICFPAADIQAPLGPIIHQVCSLRKLFRIALTKGFSFIRRDQPDDSAFVRDAGPRTKPKHVKPISNKMRIPPQLSLKIRVLPFTPSELNPDSLLRLGFLAGLAPNETEPPPRAFAYALARASLGAALGCKPGDVLFIKDSRGKPKASVRGRTDDRSCAMSLSHSAGLVGVAVDLQPDGNTFNLELGFDVEQANRDVGERVASSFPPEEREWLDSLPVDQRAMARLRLWTLKEALAKATGDGIWKMTKGPVSFNSRDRSSSSSSSLSKSGLFPEGSTVFDVQANGLDKLPASHAGSAWAFGQMQIKRTDPLIDAVAAVAVKWKAAGDRELELGAGAVRWEVVSLEGLMNELATHGS